MNTNAYALLSLLSKKSLTGYEMKKQVELALSHFWKTSYGQIYPTMKRFIEDGLVTVEKIENENAPNSKLYTITDKGNAALVDWLRIDVDDINRKDEALLKFYFSDLLPIDEVIKMTENALAYNIRIKESYQKDVDEMLETKRPTRHQLNIYLATRKGVHLNEARIKWAEDCLASLKWYQTLENTPV